MALAVNDIVQLTDVQTYLTQQVLNVYYWRVDSLEALTDLNDIAEVFSTYYIGAIDDIQSTGIVHTRAIVKNLTNGVDIHEEVYSIAGTATGDNLASFYASAFRLVRSNLTTRHGQKRIGGIPEGHVNGNAITAGIAAAYAAVATVLGSQFVRTGTVDHDFSLTPVIVGRIPTGSPGAGQLDLSIINPISSAQFIRVTTQTTRREGRGS